MFDRNYYEYLLSVSNKYGFDYLSDNEQMYLIEYENEYKRNIVKEQI